MTISVIAHTSAALGPNGGATTGVNMTGATLLVAFVAYYSSGPTPTISDSQSNTWTGLTAQAVTNTVSARFWYAAAPSVGSSHTVTVSGTGIYASVCFAGFNPIQTSSPFRNENGATTASSTFLQTGSAGLSTDLLVTGLGINSGATPSIDSSMTILDTTSYVSGDHFAASLAWIQATGATNPTWTVSSAIDLAAVIASFIQSSTSDNLLGQAVL